MTDFNSAAPSLAEQLDSMPALSDAGYLRVGFSGGLDSSVLLSVAAQWGRAKGIPVQALHVHHGLQPEADRFASHCKLQAKKLGVAFECRKVVVVDQGKGPEGNARQARLDAFTDSIQQGQVLLLAHHHQDQVETLLMRLFRGASLSALGGMPAIRTLGAGQLARPFLHVSHDQLRHYARSQKLSWLEDPSNQNLDFERNRIRHLLLPVLQKHWPDYDRAFDRLAGQMKSVAALLAEVAGEDLQRVAGRATATEPCYSLYLPALRVLSPARRMNLIYFWLADRGFWQLTEAQYQALDRQVMTTSRPFHFTWPEGAFASFQKKLWLLKGGPPEAGQATDWHPGQPYACSFGTLSTTATRGSGLKAGLPLQIRYQVAGAQLRIKGMRKSLKKICQQYGIPTWARPWLPLVFSSSNLVAVADICVAEDAIAGDGEAGWLLNWQGSSDYTCIWRIQVPSLDKKQS